MKFIDLFAGIGGFHSGLEQNGHECVGWVEWDKFARQSYEALYDTKGLYTAHDIKSIPNGNDFPYADIWTFGSPCTNISIAGNRKGLQGEQSSMFFEVIRLLNDRDWEAKPTYLILENVKNLLLQAYFVQHLFSFNYQFVIIQWLVRKYGRITTRICWTNRTIQHVNKIISCFSICCLIKHTIESKIANLN